MNKENLKIIYAILVIVLFGAGIFLLTKYTKESEKPVFISNFEECAATGVPIMESYPRQCRYDGKLFVEEFPENEIPENPEVPVSLGGCKVAGCSGQLCVSEGEEGMSTCEYRTEYACYKKSRCERQSDNKCGWTKTDGLNTCLINPPVM